MIYKNNTTPPLVLTEADADYFLESVGVELFEDEIGINGTLYEGSYGESILEENGIFLYEDGIVLEGDAAEKYLKDKRAKKEAENTVRNKYGARTYSGYGTFDNDSLKSNPNKKNPRFDTARSLKDHRFYYDDVMPKKKSTSEIKYDIANKLNDSDHRAAKEIVDKEFKRRGLSKNSLNNFDKYQNAYSAAMRRERKNYKKFKSDVMKRVDRNPKMYDDSPSSTSNESTIFSDIEII